MVTGQKVRWVLDLMRGTEFAGPHDHVVRDRRARPRVPRRRAAGSRARRRAPRPHRAARPRCSRSATRGTIDAVPAPRRAAAGTCCSTPGPVAGFGWAVLHRRRRRRARRRRCTAPTTRRRNEHLRVDGRPARRHVRDRDDRRPRASPASGGSSTAATAATRTTTPRPPTDRVIDAPDAVRVSDARSRPGAGARARSTPTTRGPRSRSATTGRARAAATRPYAVTVAHDPRAARRRAVPAGHARARQPRARPPAARALPAAGTGRRLRRRVRVRGRAPRAHRRRRRPRVRAADVPVAPLRRRVRRRRSASRSCTTACSSTRSSTTAASSRSRCCARSATSRAPSRRCARTRPARPIPVRRARSCSGAQRAEYAVLLHRGDWRAADCYGAADAFARAVRTRARGGRRDADRPASRAGAARRRRRGLGGARAAPGGLVVRVFRTDARRRARSRSSTRARPPAAGSSTSAAARSPRSKAQSSSAPWQLCTLHLDVIRTRRDSCTPHGASTRGLAEELEDLDRRRRSRRAVKRPAGTKRVAGRGRAPRRPCSSASASAVPGSAAATRRAARLTVGP